MATDWSKILQELTTQGGKLATEAKTAQEKIAEEQYTNQLSEIRRQARAQQSGTQQARQAIAEQGFVGQRQLMEGLAQRGLGASGIEQLAQTQQRIGTGQQFSQLEQQAGLTREALTGAVGQAETQRGTAKSQAELNYLNTQLQLGQQQFQQGIGLEDRDRAAAFQEWQKQFSESQFAEQKTQNAWTRGFQEKAYADTRTDAASAAKYRDDYFKWLQNTTTYNQEFAREQFDWQKLQTETGKSDQYAQSYANYLNTITSAGDEATATNILNTYKKQGLLTEEDLQTGLSSFRASQVFGQSFGASATSSINKVNSAVQAFESKGEAVNIDFSVTTPNADGTTSTVKYKTINEWADPILSKYQGLPEIKNGQVTPKVIYDSTNKTLKIAFIANGVNYNTFNEASDAVYRTR
jgi:hypothetical protein